MIEENAALSAAIKQKSAAYTALERELAICRAQRADFAAKLAKAKKRAERKRADARKWCCCAAGAQLSHICFLFSLIYITHISLRTTHTCIQSR